MSIKIKNISSANLTISLPDIRFRVELVPGREKIISKEQYDDLMFDAGVQNMLAGGYLKIDGAETDEAQEAVKTSGFASADMDEISEILDKRDIASFTKLIQKASPATKDTIVRLAIEKNIADRPFIALIDKYCGIDTLDALTKQRQSEAK